MKTNTTGLTPVSRLEAMQRVNKKLEEEGLEIKPHPTGFCLCDERGNVCAVNVCLDTEAINQGVLADNEFLCWPEEAATLAA